MKHLLVLFSLSLALGGCMPRLSTPVQLFEGRAATVFDFTPYLERDFLFMAGPFQGAYEPRGFIELTFSPRTTDVLRADRGQIEGWVVDQSRVDPLLAQMYERARTLDANAITHFSVDIERRDVGKAVYRISGFAIRRR